MHRHWLRHSQKPLVSCDMSIDLRVVVFLVHGLRSNTYFTSLFSSPVGNGEFLMSGVWSTSRIQPNGCGSTLDSWGFAGCSLCICPRPEPSSNRGRGESAPLTRSQMGQYIKGMCEFPRSSCLPRQSPKPRSPCDVQALAKLSPEQADEMLESAQAGSLGGTI